MMICVYFGIFSEVYAGLNNHVCYCMNVFDAPVPIHLCPANNYYMDTMYKDKAWYCCI